MPVNQAAMKSMKKEYGPEKGERVYYASVNAGKIKEEKLHMMCARVREAIFGRRPAK